MASAPIDIKAALRRAIDDFPVIALRPDTTFAHALAEIERLEAEVARLEREAERDDSRIGQALERAYADGESAGYADGLREGRLERE